MRERQWQKQQQAPSVDRTRKPNSVHLLQLEPDRSSLAVSRAAGQGGRSFFEGVQRLVALSPSAGRESVLRLQRSCGNHYVQRALTIARSKQGETAVAPEIEEAIGKGRGGGTALDSGVRAQMEPAFGADFSRVRVHTGSQADSLNQSLGARAFTTGKDIFFRGEEYQPGNSSGRQLLAHELTHVVQQNSDVIRPALESREKEGACCASHGPIQRSLTVSEPHDAFELEADRVARVIMEQEQGPANRSLSRQAVPPEEEEKEKQLQRQEMPEEEEEKVP